MTECPFCGDFEGDDTQVAAHASSKIDDDHKGVGYQHAISAIEAGDTTEATETAGVVQEPDIPEAQDTDDYEDCPNCGASLGHSEAEIRQFIQDHGSAWCDECGAEIVIDDD